VLDSGDELHIDSADDDDLARLHQWFDALASKLPNAMHYGMRVALEEAVMNVAMHAYPPNASGEIIIQLRTSPEAATLLVEDSGRAFDSTSAPVPERPVSLPDAEPGGLGLPLLRHYCRDISYTRVGERNRLLMRFPLPAQ
jgi:serine/threonine-protein kinase RsbW